jgi:hypothetical protein
MSLLELCESVEYSALLIAMRGLWWFFPVLATIHLLGLAVLGGAVLLVDLRLLGFGIRSQPAGQLVREAEPWLVGSLAVMVVSGSILWMCFATKYYYLAFFWVKVAALLLVIPFTFSVRRRVAMAHETSASPVVGRMVALVSLCLWTIIALGGRWIGFP